MGQLADLVSLWHGRPLLYFRNFWRLLDSGGVHRTGGIQRFRLAIKR